MVVVLIVLAVLVLVFALWVFATRTKQRSPERDFRLQDYYYAHRGLHKASHGIPENSFYAFRIAAAAGFGAELDVHISADKRLVVMHDDNLSRMCGIDRNISEMTSEELNQCRLLNTNEKIPYLEEVLPIFSGKAPLIVEVKSCDNYEELTAMTCQMLDAFPEVRYCMESFDPRIVRWLRKNRPEIIRGQLSCNFFEDTPAGMGKFGAFLFSNLLGNFFGVPDFVAYKVEDRNNLSFRFCRWMWNPTEVSWTVREPELFAEATADDRVVIFENCLPGR